MVRWCVDDYESQIEEIKAISERLQTTVLDARRAKTLERGTLRRLDQSVALWRKLLGSPDLGFIPQFKVWMFHSPDTLDNFRSYVSALEETIIEGEDEKVLASSAGLDKILREYLELVEEVISSRLAETQKPVEQGTLGFYLVNLGDFIADVQKLIAHDESLVWAAEAKQAAAEAETAKDNAKQASSATSEVAMAGEFAKFGVQESKQATTYRAATISLIVVGILVSIALHSLATASVAEAIYKLAILGAIFGLAGYLGRQAGHHRDLAVWARTINVQLQTFEAFLDPIGDEANRDHARLAFASRVFGAVPQSKEAPTGPSNEIFEQIISLANKANSSK